MLIPLKLDRDVFDAAREIARDQRRSLGSVVSELARRGLREALVVLKSGVPVIQTPAGAEPITLEMVRRGLDEN
jgi:hypothetical protein